MTLRSEPLQYVLVADANGRRTEFCLDVIKRYSVDVVVARHGDEAIGALRTFGAPLLLLVDLSLPQQDGFAVIEAVRRIEHQRTRIVAWSATREIREFAAARLAGSNARVLDGSVGPAIVRSAIERHLPDATQARIALPQRSSSSAGVHQTLEELTEKARELCGTPGVAVYLASGPERLFRSSVTWLPDDPIPSALDALPTVLKRVVETREPLVALDFASQRSAEAAQFEAGDLRGLVAVPIFQGDEPDVVGMICVFDVKALTIGVATIEALRTLGRRGVAARPPAGAVALRPVSRWTHHRSHPVGGGPRLVGQPAALLDRQGGRRALSREMARARRQQNQLSVVVFDVDAADTDDDTSEAADHRMESAGKMLTRVIREYDLAIRWSPQELLIALPGVGKADADRVAERVRDIIYEGGGPRLSIAGGAAELEDDNTPESVVLRALEQLRQAPQRVENG